MIIIPAHIRKNGEVYDEQSVPEHLRNVGRYSGIYGSKINLNSCAELLGQIHDIGKMCKEFDQYIWHSYKNPDIKSQGPDHSTAGAVWIMSLINENSKPIECLTVQIIAISIMGHHGGLGDIYDTFGESPYIKRLNKIINDSEWIERYYEVLANMESQLDVAYLKSLFIEAVEEINSIYLKIRETDQDFQYALGLLCKFLYSCLIDGDRYDTATFMDGEKMEPPKDNKELWRELSKRLDNKISKLVSDSEINKLRKSISNSCLENSKRDTGVYTLSCPTGSGKTFSSLRFALNHAKECNKERIFFIIPFISITDQNAAEIRKILSIYDNDELVRNSIFELHSAQEVDEDKDEVEIKKAELVSERMDSPIILTTMVRFLNTFFARGTRNMRALHNFANSIIVFDEVQTLSPKFIGMFNGLLNFLATVCNATIVLSTATQPSLNYVPDTIKPLHISKDPEISGFTQEMFSRFKRTEFVDKTEVGGNTIEFLGNLIWKNSLDKGNSLIVMNTKTSVEILYQELKENYDDRLIGEGFELYVLTTNLCPAHRKQKIKEIKEKLNMNKNIIVISTQLIEAGVDISFRCVFRSIAGMDSIIQSAGRCNRHGENGHGNYGYVFLINPAFETLGSLIDIQKGKETTDTLLRMFKSNPEQFNNDLNTLITIDTYYKIYYLKQKNNMTYRFNDMGREFLMYDLLDKNDILKKEAWSHLGYKDPKVILSQSFKTAASNFKAIDDYGKSILVPYGEGKEIIKHLLSTIKNSEISSLLKKAQQYSVNINIGTAKKLGNAVKYYESIGAYILSENYYDNTFGVSTSLVSNDGYFY